VLELLLLQQLMLAEVPAVTNNGVMKSGMMLYG
jgi:hypothetical protein